MSQSQLAADNYPQPVQPRRAVLTSGRRHRPPGDHHTLGVFIPLLGGSYFSAILGGIQQVAQDHGLQVIAIQAQPQYCRERRLALARVDGWIVVDDLSGAREIAADGVPTVVVGAVTEPLFCPTVLIDVAHGVRCAVQHLIEHGHHRIGLVGAPRDYNFAVASATYQATLAGAGIAFDERLLFKVENNTEASGFSAGQRLVEQGLPCTAALVHTDQNAIGLIRALRETGYRVPEDMAVVSRDDIEAAQSMHPPLTTIHQPCEALGATAARLLLDQLAGHDVARHITYVPTALAVRRSCGCERAQAPLAIDGSAGGCEPAWHMQLADRLITLARYPLPLQGDSARAQIRPAMLRLITSLETALQHAEEADARLLRRTWTEILGLTKDIDRLHGMLQRLEEATLQHCGGTTSAVETLQGLNRWGQVARLELMRAYLASELARSNYLERLLESNYKISMGLLEQGGPTLLDLSWLRETQASAGYLGLWQPNPGGHEERIVIAGRYSRDGAAQAEPGSCYTASDFPPPELLPANPDGAGRELVKILPIRTDSHDRGRGVLLVCGPSDTRLATDHENIGMWAALLSAAFEREALMQSLAEQQETLRAAYEREHALAEEREALLGSLLQAKLAAEEANRLKTQFLTNISHELRTPLNSIINFVDLLDTQRFRSFEGRSYLKQRLVANSEHLLGLINDILDLAKIEAGRMEINLEAIDLRPILQGVISTTVGLTKDKPIELTLDLPGDLPPAWADKSRLRQILLNLLSNAAKFTAQGQIRLSARAAEPGLLTLAVQDTGIGIAEHDQRLIFEEFRQVQHGGQKQQGTGLGLPICKRLVELHRGRMWVESAPGHGSTFAFTLPVATSADLPQTETRKQAAPATDRLVALVDEQPGQHDSLRRYLEQLGWRVLVVAREPEMLVTLPELRPSLVILGTSPQAADAAESIGRLRAQLETAGIPLLFSAMVEQQTLGLALGANDYLVKPVQEAQVLAAVERWAGHNALVLVVEDDRDAREIVRFQLEERGYRVIEAADGREGLTRVREAQPELIILDLMMPEMDGFEMLESLRADSTTRSIPVLVLTAQLLSEVELARLQRGVAAILEKGVFRTDEVLSHVEAILSGARRSGGQGQELVRTAVAYMHAHYAERLTRQQIARALSISADHLTHCFQQELKLSPMTYLTRYRISQAQRLLAEGDLRVADVAAAVGFVNEFHFSRVFQREVGVSPGAYRRGRRRSD